MSQAKTTPTPSEAPTSFIEPFPARTVGYRGILKTDVALWMAVRKRHNHEARRLLRIVRAAERLAVEAKLRPADRHSAALLQELLEAVTAKR